MQGARALFLGVYLLSGFAALVYEVVWSRLLGLHMGHTVAAVSTVLGAFMGGLAIGAALGGVYAPRLSRVRALVAYAALEAAIAATALVLPIALASLRPLLAWAYADGHSGLLFPLVRLGTALVLVAIPAVAMGATLPIAVRWFVRGSTPPGHQVGLLYAGNTLGAAVGAFAAGFLLIPALGLHGTTLIAVAMNLLAGGVSIWLASRKDAHAEPVPRLPLTPRRDRRRAAPAVALETARPRVAAAAVFASGAVAMVFQVAWTRILAATLGPTTFAFSAMLAAFIIGLAMGSGSASVALKRRARPVLLLGLTLVAGAIGALSLAYLVNRLPYAVAWMVARPDATFTSIMVLQSAAVVIMLLPMTVPLGAAFPIAVAVGGGTDATLSRGVSAVYVANTIGAIAGALAGGFLLVPSLGLQNVVLAASAAAAIAGALIVIAGGATGHGRLAAIVASVLALAVCAASPSWDREMLSSGAYKYAPYLADLDLRASLGVGTLLYYDEGSGGTVSVRRAAGTLMLAIDGKVDASNGSDMLTQKLLGHLPLLLHPDAREVAIIGLGSGVTLGAALAHPVQRVDMIEISPQVVEASRFFAAESRHALDDRRTNLLIGDGRSHFLLSSRRYDVIISEPSNPWMAGVSALFTREFFGAARARLAADGLFCQWAHTYDIGDADLRSIVATFRSVFPEGTVWLVGQGDLLLVGGAGDREPRLEAVAASWRRAAVAADLETVDAREPFSVLSLYLGGGAFMARYAGDAPAQTDDRTGLEFSAPMGIYGRSTDDNTSRLRRLAADGARPRAVAEAYAAATAAHYRNRGLMQLGAAAHAAAYDDLARALREDPSDEQALEALPRAAAGCDRIPAATALLAELAGRRPTNLAARRHFSRILAGQGLMNEALAAADEALRLAPEDPGVHEQLASLAADAGDTPRLASVVARMDARWPDAPATLYARGTLLFLTGQHASAAAVAARLAGLTPRDARVHNLLGASYASIGRSDDARRAFEASIASNPRDPAAYVNLGVFELGASNPAAAAGYFAEALAIDQHSTGALRGLAEALSRQGHHARAARLLARAGGA